MKHILLAFLLCINLAHATQNFFEKAQLNLLDASTKSYNDLKRNSYIKSAERKALTPYILPANHPIKGILDAIFLTSRATTNREALLNAGFQILATQPRSFILVVRHPSLPGYLIKLHLDNDNRKKHGKPGWKWFERRIRGANDIAKCILKNNVQHFKVPKKWVYPLPIDPSPPAGYHRKNFILVVEDMELLSRTDNHFAWRHHTTPEKLDELLLILKSCGGQSMRASNIPYSVDGKIAFIDTEYPGKTPQYSYIDPYLSPEMLAYWKSITKR